MNRSTRMFVTALFVSILFSTANRLVADDWPAWRGAKRDGICRETGLLKQWPEEGPKLLWKTKGLGEGYSGPAIVGDVLYIMGSKAGREWVFALDVAKDGAQIWAADIGPIEYDGLTSRIHT